MSDAWKTAQREAQRRRQAAEKSAMKLDQIGMSVIVILDDGQEMNTRLASLPWTLGCGLYVVKVEGISGGYDCARIRPAGKAVAA